MFDDEKRYQNLLEEIHQLNRQNFVNNNDKIDDLNNKLLHIEKNIFNLSNKNYEKQILILFIIIGLNLFLTIVSFILILSLPNNETNSKLNEKKLESNLTKNENFLELKKEDILIDETFETIKPIIKKDTSYYCSHEEKTYKIPYTVEIKGKLYKDKFTFILKDDQIEKDCFIKRENL